MRKTLSGRLARSLFLEQRNGKTRGGGSSFVETEYPYPLRDKALREKGINPCKARLCEIVGLFYCKREPLAERVDKRLKPWTNKKTCIKIRATGNRK